MTKSDLDKLWNVVPSAKPMRRRQAKSGNVSICTPAQRSNTSLVGWRRQVAFTDYRAVCRWAEKCACTIEEKFSDPAQKVPGALAECRFWVWQSAMFIHGKPPLMFWRMTA